VGGTHLELLERAGRYAELWSRQASLDDMAALSDEAKRLAHCYFCEVAAAAS
jgi:hypothetical protein